MTWVISVPAWGERYLSILERLTFPALGRAMAELTGSHRVLVHTDAGDRVQAAGRACGLEVVTLPVLGDDRAFGSLSAAHAHALSMAKADDVVVLLTADMIVSPELLLTCERHFASGRQLVCTAGMRVNDTVTELNMPSGQALLEWGWENRHAMTRESTWPEGRSYDVWRMYFLEGENAACRLCLPHPLALVRGHHPLSFSPTIDVNLCTNFGERYIHLVTDPQEGAVIELSPPDKEFLLTEPMRSRYENPSVAGIPTFTRITNPRHRFFFRQRITIRGDGSASGDGLVTPRFLGGS